MKLLTRDHLDAMCVTLYWFGGRMNRMDAGVASIHCSLFRDLVDMGLMRSLWLSWEITAAGRAALRSAGITSISDTRVY